MEPQHKEIKTYRFLVIGRMGDGKSSLCRFLTGLSSIQVSSKIGSCTHNCQIYKSNDKLNQQRGYAIQVVDTPGLDSNKQNLLQTVMELADLFTKSQYLNGILYTVSMSQSRDETISWFLNFLRLYFTKEQLKTSIIPILTHYDKLLFEQDQKVMEMKNSRKQGIHKIWGQDEEQVINFWENHLEWINDANQKAGLRDNPDFKEIYFYQLPRLIHKADEINLQLSENAKKFQENLLKQLGQQIKQKKGQFKTVIQQIEPIKFKVNLNQLCFWKTVKDLKSKFSKVLIGTIVVLGLKGYAWKKYKNYEKSMEKIDVGLFESVKTGINKVMNAQFNLQFFQWINVNTSSKDTVQDLNRVFSKGGMCHIHITLPEDAYFGVSQMELSRIFPESNQPCVLLPKEKENKITFQDNRRFTDEQERVYEFRNIKILRPEDEFLNQILTNIVKNK